MTKVLGSPKVQYFKPGSSAFLEGGKVYTYKSRTATPKATYPTIDDADNETNANANPVILDARGEADIVLKGPTRLVITDENDSTISITDNLDSGNANILDDNGVGLISFASVKNAVNYLEISNASTGSNPVLEAKGDDTNVDLGIRPKGNGNSKVPTGDFNVSLGDVTLLSGNVEIAVGDLTLDSGDFIMGTGTVVIGDPTATLSALPAGLVMFNGSATVPSGWLECDGSAISRTTYASLFAAIGTAFGVGDGSTTFNLPNQERSVLVGKDGTGTGTLGNAIGDTGGAETHTLTEAEMPSHIHEWNWYRANQGIDVGPLTVNTFHRDCSPVSYFDTQTTGSGTAHNIMQPSLVAMLIIRAY